MLGKAKVALLPRDTAVLPSRRTMLFSSLVFLFQFLPWVLAAYYVVVVLGWTVGSRIAGLRAGNLLLLLASLFFYAWGEPLLTVVMLTATIIAFAAGLGIAKAQRRAQATGATERVGRGWLVGASICMLGMLAFFKYANFAVENWNGLVSLLGKAEWNVGMIAVALPLGISFYTFQALSYVIDVYRREVPATSSLIDFACYVTMFPQLVAGPIVRYTDVARELVERVHSRHDIAAGAMRFVTGLAKKVLIANTVAGPADAIFGMPGELVTPAHAWLGIVCYTLQIYFDFSAYSDMAIGLGRMMGFNFPENFNYPYIARSNQEFWRRWHISLSTWFRDYVYIPLGGNRAGGFGTYRNLVVVFLLCGLWHGAAWNYVIWGLYHGLFLVLERRFLGRALLKLPTPIQHLYLLLVAMAGWVLFRVETLDQAGVWFAAMCGSGAVVGSPVHYLDPKLLVMLVSGCIFATPLAPMIALAWRRRIDTSPANAAWMESAAAITRPVLVSALLALSAAALASGTHNPFIYSRF